MPRVPRTLGLLCTISGSTAILSRRLVTVSALSVSQAGMTSCGPRGDSGANGPRRSILDLVSRGAKIATGVAAVAIVAGLVALAYPAFAALGSFEQRTTKAVAATERTTAPPPTPAPSPAPSRDDGSGDCPAEASISFSAEDKAHMVPTLVNVGALTDRGARPGARGDVVRDAQGIYSYIVAPNDNLISIDARLCFDYTSLRMFNHVLANAIQPGAQLILRPDPTIPWINPYTPFDAVPGVTNTVDFNSTMYEMGAAVRTHDLDSARALWARSLSGHVSPAAQAAATKALDDGDWPVLEQMFP